jgi:hypothetical protein
VSIEEGQVVKWSRDVRDRGKPVDLSQVGCSLFGSAAIIDSDRRDGRIVWIAS